MSLSPNSSHPPPDKSPLKNPYLYTSIVLIVVLAYTALIFVSRHQSNRAFERRETEKASEQRRADDRAP